MKCYDNSTCVEDRFHLSVMRHGYSGGAKQDNDLTFHRQCKLPYPPDGLLVQLSLNLKYDPLDLAVVELPNRSFLNP